MVRFLRALWFLTTGSPHLPGKMEASSGGFPLLPQPTRRQAPTKPRSFGLEGASLYFQLESSRLGQRSSTLVFSICSLSSSPPTNEWIDSPPNAPVCVANRKWSSACALLFGGRQLEYPNVLYTSLAYSTLTWTSNVCVDRESRSSPTDRCHASCGLTTE